jgi:hypothetical protein
VFYNLRKLTDPDPVSGSDQIYKIPLTKEIVQNAAVSSVVLTKSSEELLKSVGTKNLDVKKHLFLLVISTFRGSDTDPESGFVKI